MTAEQKKVIAGIATGLILLLIAAFRIGALGSSPCDDVRGWDGQWFKVDPETCRAVAANKHQTEAETAREMNAMAERNYCRSRHTFALPADAACR